MPSSDSQAFLREFIRSDDTPVVSKETIFIGKLIDVAPETVEKENPNGAMRNPRPKTHHLRS